MSLTLRSLSESQSARQQMIENGSVGLLCDVVGASQKLDIGAETFPQCATTLYNFASCVEFKKLLVDQGALTALKMLGTDDTVSVFG